jgi:tetratricopeptide (TPR) repeat protein
MGQNAISGWDTIVSTTRDVLLIIMLVVQSCHASEPSKEWSAWLSEGKALWSAGNYSAAVHAFREGLALARRSDVTRLQLVPLHQALADAYAAAGQYKDSEGEYQCTLALIEKAEGRRSLDYAVVLALMAVLPTQTGHREEMIAFLREAISANARTGSIENITAIRECLAQVLRREKRYQEEEPLLVDALSDLAKQKAAATNLMAAALNNLGVLRFDQERYEESVDLQEKAIRVWEMARGEQHPALVTPLNDLAAVYVKMGRFYDAVVAFQRAMDICRKTLGEDRLEYAVLLKNYAHALRKLGRKREAKAAETQAQLIQRELNRRNGVGASISATALRSDRAMSGPR